MKDEARTIRQAIKDSLDMVEDKETIIEGEKQIFHGIFPLPFRYLITNMAAILYGTVAHQQGKEIDKDIMDVLCGNNFLDSLFLGVHIGQFFSWWLDREAYIDIGVDDSEERMWYHPQDMLDAWNEFLKQGSEKP